MHDAFCSNTISLLIQCISFFFLLFNALLIGSCFPSQSCMLMTLCYITVETMNETVAALYNITDFYGGECYCIGLFPLSPSFSVNPALILPS